MHQGCVLIRQIKCNVLNTRKTSISKMIRSMNDVVRQVNGFSRCKSTTTVWPQQTNEGRKEADKQKRKSMSQSPTVADFTICFANEVSIHRSTSFVGHVHILVLNESIGTFRRGLRDFQIDCKETFETPLILLRSLTLFDCSVSTEHVA